MKNKYLIMLLSVLLCVAVLFTACDKKSKEDEPTDPEGSTQETTGEEETTAPTTDTTPPAQVEPEIANPTNPKLSDFFKFEAVDAGKLGTAKRYEGVCVAQFEEVFVMKTSSVDEKNKITEVFTVYNANEQEPILKFENKFDNGDFNHFNWNDYYITEEDLTSNGDEIKYPSKLMKVALKRIEEDVDTSTAVIEVATATVKPIEVDLKENPNGNYFEVKTEYAYYDLFGTLINKTAKPQQFNGVYPGYLDDNDVVCISVGKISAYLDATNGKVIKTVAADNEVDRAVYDVQTVKYGFYMDQYSSGPMDVDSPYFEAYNKETGELVTRYYFESADSYSAFVLRNGNVFIQYANMLPYDSNHEYDMELMGLRFTLDTYVLNIETGELTEIDANFIAQEIVPNNEWADTEMYKELNGVTFTENVVNIANIVYIDDTKCIDLQNESQLAVINNDGSVMFAMAPIVPEHKISLNDQTVGLGIRMLKTGDMLVDLEDVVATRAIVGTDGKIRCYLNENEVVVGRYICRDDGIYDFDKNLVKSIDALEDERVFAAFGETVIIARDYSYEGESGEESGTNYYVYDAMASTIYSYVSTLGSGDGNRLEISYMSDDFIVVYDSVESRYTVFNERMEHVLTTKNAVDICEIDNGYVISTELNGKTLMYYTVK